MYARQSDGKDLTFDFAEGLINDNLLLVDRETRSVWSQMDGKAVSGPMQGSPMQIIPAVQATWSFWKQRHPDTRAMVEDEEGRPYWYRNRKPGSPRPSERPTEHDTSVLGLGLAVGTEAWFFPFAQLAEASTPLNMEVGGQAVVIHYSQKGLTAWAEDAAGNLLSAVLVYRDGWMDFFPESSIYQAAN